MATQSFCRRTSSFIEPAANDEVSTGLLSLIFRLVGRRFGGLFYIFIRILIREYCVLAARRNHL